MGLIAGSFKTRDLAENMTLGKLNILDVWGAGSNLTAKPEVSPAPLVLSVPPFISAPFIGGCLSLFQVHVLTFSGHLFVLISGAFVHPGLTFS